MWRFLRIQEKPRQGGVFAILGDFNLPDAEQPLPDNNSLNLGLD